MQQVKVINKSPFQLPKYATSGSAAMDVRAVLDQPNIMIYPGMTEVIKTGLFFEIPVGYCIKAYSRSGISIKRGLCLANGVGVIDSDYRGELLIALNNQRNHVQVLEHGERIAQIMLEKVEPFELIQVGVLTETERGAGGLGSTGEK